MPLGVEERAEVESLVDEACEIRSRYRVRVEEVFMAILVHRLLTASGGTLIADGLGDLTDEMLRGHQLRWGRRRLRVEGDTDEGDDEDEEEDD